VKRVLRAEGTLLRGLALDPEGAYVAAAGSDGSLWLWETADGNQAHRGRGLAAKVRVQAVGLLLVRVWSTTRISLCLIKQCNCACSSNQFLLLMFLLLLLFLLF
jgi:hypothetical protein